MKLTRTMETINGAYQGLHERAEKLANVLARLGHKVEWGYFGQHSTMVDGDYFLEYYPVPVITVKDVCDVGLDFTQVWVEGKLYSGAARELELNFLKKYDFSIYGIDNYLQELYEDGMSDEELHEAIASSEEREIGIAITLDDEPLTREIIEAVHLMMQLGTHIIIPPDESDESTAFEQDELEEDAPAYQILDAFEKA